MAGEAGSAHGDEVVKEESTEWLEKVPKGFKVAREGAEGLHVEYRHTGMGCMVVFLLLWLSAWTVGCVFIVRDALSHSFWEKPALYLFAVPFLAAEIAVAGILLWIFFGRTHFVLTPDALEVTQRLFNWSRTRVFPLDDIAGFRQVKDGGEGDDSFPSWGLCVEGSRSMKILSRQDRGKSQWLGGLLSAWSGKAFRTGGQEYQRE